MSHVRPSRSPDLQRLVEDGYDVSLLDGLLLVRRIPFVLPGRALGWGMLAVPLTMRGDRTAAPRTHMTYWCGGPPCDLYGRPLGHVIQAAIPRTLAGGIASSHSLCVKPPGREFHDHHELVETYVALLSSHALAMHPSVSARDRRRRATIEPDSGPFQYLDTATPRAGTGDLIENIRRSAIGIVGLGGTGSYVLDLVAKTPVRAIHLFDADTFDQHNAFRAPGAASIEEIQRGSSKVDHLARTYSRMHRRIVPHAVRIDARNAPLLDLLDFVFLCVDDGGAKPPIVSRLAERDIPFIDVGMGLTLTDAGLIGAVRTSVVRSGGHAQAVHRIPMTADPDDVYASNIQVAELNALNAAFAVLAWKRLAGFYAVGHAADASVYVVEENRLFSED